MTLSPAIQAATDIGNLSVTGAAVGATRDAFSRNFPAKGGVRKRKKRSDRAFRRRKRGL